jgi:hypothetical protein
LAAKELLFASHIVPAGQALVNGLVGFVTVTLITNSADTNQKRW